MREFVKYVVNRFMLVGVDFPLAALAIDKTIFPGFLNSRMTFFLWPKAEFVFKNVVQSTERTYSSSEIMEFYGLAVLSNGMSYLFLGIVAGMILWFVRRMINP